jgi:uncharacterized membrane protein YcaP (DUF421 family)
VGELLRSLLGPDGHPDALTVGQMAARAVVVYGVGLLLLRLGGPRILGRYAAIDVLTGIVAGSILSRAVNGSAPMGTTLVAGGVVIALHRLGAALSAGSDAVSAVLKGRPHVLYEEGRLREDALRRHSVDREDYRESLRITGHAPEDPRIQEVRLERNGRITVIARDEKPKTPPLDEGG